jgi:hypothetical protein
MVAAAEGIFCFGDLVLGTGTVGAAVAMGVMGVIRCVVLMIVMTLMVVVLLRAVIE